MIWFRKSLVMAAFAVIASGAAGAKNDDAAKPPAAKVDKKKGDKKDDKKAKPEAAAEKGPAKLTIPVPPGHDAKGLVIPVRDEKGNIQMRFTMDVGSRTDEEHMMMKKLLIETFDGKGDGEMKIDLLEAALNLTTRVISTETGVVIKRSDFELTGKTMTFNTETRAGHIGGKVRMLIYNLENETTPSDEAASSEK